MSPTTARQRSRLGRYLWLGCLALWLPISAQAWQDEDGLARAGLNALVRLHYQQAAEWFDRLQRQKPDYPMLAFLRAGIPWVKAEAQQKDGSDRIPAWVEASRGYQAAIIQAEAHLKNHDPDPRWQLALGMSQFFLARTYVEQHKVFKVYHYARAGRDTLRQLIQTHPHMYDAYFALGIYEYIAGSIPRGVNWLAVLFDISGDRKLGIQFLQLAVTHAPIMAPEAARMLLAAAALQPEYVDRPCQYLALARQGMAQFPQNPHFSGAYQMLHSHCGYPDMALAENARARQAYAKSFPDMMKILDIIQVQTLASMGDLEGIRAMRARFAKKNTAYWYLSMGQAEDVLGHRVKAREYYHVLTDSDEEDHPDVMAHSDNKDWLRDQVDLYLRSPYHRPEPVAFDAHNVYQLRP